MPSLNDHVDHIYVLSLPERSERRALLAQQMAEMNANYTIVEGVRAATGRLGCTLGHIKVLETAISAGHKKIFIVEDDALFRRELMTDIDGIMKETEDYDLLYFHSDPPLPFNIKNRYTIGRGAPWCTQFYAAKNLTKILIFLKTSVEVLGKDGIDYLYREGKLNTKTTIKEYVYQLDDLSDIEHKVVDRFKRKIVYDDFILPNYNVPKADKSFWIGHCMLGDVLGFCAAAHLYSVKVGRPVKVHFEANRRDACRFFDGVLWVPERTTGMIDCGGNPSMKEWPTMNGVKRFYRFMDPTLTPTKSFDVHFNRPRPQPEGNLIGLITHSNTQGDIDPETLAQMLQEARQRHPGHKIVLIGNKDNTLVPEGVEDLRQERGNISWIIDMIGKLDLLISPQSGPCFIAAGWRVPMWIYRSKERFWDWTLNYETHKVERWFERPGYEVETPPNYLDLCRQANQDFYAKVKVLIDTKVVIVYRKNFTNIGDFSSNPSLYFDLPVAEVIDIEDDKAITKCLAQGYWFIIGGGGLFATHGRNRLANLELIVNGGKAIIWGAGKNSLTDFKNRTEFVYPESLKRARLVGLRDRDQTLYSWVPCASCMSDAFSKEYTAVTEQIVYSHPDHRIDETSKTNRSFETIADCLSYIGSGKRIFTSSYHGAFWGCLIGRRVFLKSIFNTKFHGL